VPIDTVRYSSLYIWIESNYSTAYTEVDFGWCDEIALENIDGAVEVCRTIQATMPRTALQMHALFYHRLEQWFPTAAPWAACGSQLAFLRLSLTLENPTKNIKKSVYNNIKKNKIHIQKLPLLGLESGQRVYN